MPSSLVEPLAVMCAPPPVRQSMSETSASGMSTPVNSTPPLASVRTLARCSLSLRTRIEPELVESVPSESVMSLGRITLSPDSSRSISSAAAVRSCGPGLSKVPDSRVGGPRKALFTTANFSCST
jgi:hypothetical protein